ncbi:MAG: phasin superfamily protein [Thermodesulfobacteriota bacterium]|nr:phasin superfamily protein [Thermodesulfobacteriota bacterium]
MLEIIEKTLLTTLGAASLTQQKSGELVNELKERFNLSEKEGQDLVEKLQKSLSKQQSQLEEQATQEVLKACERVGLVTQQEFAELKKRVERLETAASAQ